MKELFFALIQAALYERNFGKFPELSLKQWKALTAMARRQTVTGLLYRGVNHLPKGYAMPEEIMLWLASEVETIAHQGRKILQVADSLTTRYGAEGLHPVIMKGPEVAEFYPHPLLRESGDLDLYFAPEEFEKAVSLAGETHKAPDGSVHFKEDDVDIDLHRRYFDIHGRKLPEVPSPEATLLMLSGHILKHCMGAGIGLRQLCDMAMAYKGLNVPPERLRACFKDAGLERWNRLLFSFLHKYLGTEPLYEDLPDPEPLLKIVLEGGNFGHHSKAREASLHKSAFRRKLGTVRLFLRRLPFSFRYGRKEIGPTLGELIKGNLTH